MSDFEGEALFAPRILGKDDGQVSCLSVLSTLGTSSREEEARNERTERSGFSAERAFLFINHFALSLLRCQASYIGSLKKVKEDSAPLKGKGRAGTNKRVSSTAYILRFN